MENATKIAETFYHVMSQRLEALGYEPLATPADGDLASKSLPEAYAQNLEVILDKLGVVKPPMQIVRSFGVSQDFAKLLSPGNVLTFKFYCGTFPVNDDIRLIHLAALASKATYGPDSAYIFRNQWDIVYLDMDAGITTPPDVAVEGVLPLTRQAEHYTQRLLESLCITTKQR